MCTHAPTYGHGLHHHNRKKKGKKVEYPLFFTRYVHRCCCFLLRSHPENELRAVVVVYSWVPVLRKLLHHGVRHVRAEHSLDGYAAAQVDPHAFPYAVRPEPDTHNLVHSVSRIRSRRSACAIRRLTSNIGRVLLQFPSTVTTTTGYISCLLGDER